MVRPLVARFALRAEAGLRAVRDFPALRHRGDRLIRSGVLGIHVFLFFKHLADDARLVELDALRPGSDLAELVRWTASQNEEAIAWVGHAPDVTDLAAALIGDSSAAIRFAKGAAAAIEFAGETEAGKGELNWLSTAKLLGC